MENAQKHLLRKEGLEVRKSDWSSDEDIAEDMNVEGNRRNGPRRLESKRKLVQWRLGLLLIVAFLLLSILLILIYLLITLSRQPSVATCAAQQSLWCKYLQNDPLINVKC